MHTQRLLSKLDLFVVVRSKTSEAYSLREHLKRLSSSPAIPVCVAFLVRAMILHHIFRTSLENAVRDFPFGAEVGYVAASIARGEGFSAPLRFFHTGPTAWFTPIYPYLLASIFKVYGVFSYESGLLIRLLDSAFSAFTCWPIYAIGKKALVAMTLNVRDSSRLRDWIAYGALWAVGAEINPSVLSVLPFLALWALWPRKQHFARAAQLAVAASLIFLAGIAPWAVRNYVVFHKFIPLRSNFGLEFWLGNNIGVPDGWSPSLHPNDDIMEGAKYALMTEIPYMAEKQREGLRYMRTHPADVARFTFHRFENNWLGLWDSPADVWGHAPFYLKAVIIGNCLFSLLSLLGALFAFRSQNNAATMFASVMLVFPLVFYFTHTSLRYRFPMDPIMDVLAVYAVAYPLSRWSESCARTIRPSMAARGQEHPQAE